MQFNNLIQENFPGITMDEASHSYSLNGYKMRASVSKEIEKFYEKFDADKMAPHSARKRGITVEEITKEWNDKRDESTYRGHKVHCFAELYAFDRTLRPVLIKGQEKRYNQELAVMKFFDELPAWIFVISVEVKMYHHEYGFPGTMDLLLYDIKEDAFIIADYKTNEDLFKNYKGKLMLYPFSHLLDSPFNHYQIQLSFYQLLFEQTGKRVYKRCLIWLQPDGNYTMWSLDNYTNILKEQLKKVYG